MVIPSFSPDAPPQILAQALANAGCMVLTDVLSHESRHARREELAPHMATLQNFIQVERDA